MANVVEFLIKIKDVASGQMRQLATNTEGSFSRMSARVRTVGSSIDHLNSKIDDLTKTRRMSVDSSQITRLGREIEQLERRRDRLDNRGRSHSGGMLATGLILGGIGLAGALGAKSLSAGMDRQMASKSFEVMAGKEQGNKLHKNLIGFATDTIYGNEVFGEAKTLLGFGVAAKNVMPTLKMMGDVAMGDVEHMKSMTLAFAQTQAAGRLMGQDLLQYIDAGFNPLQAISQKTGRSMADLKEDMSKGKISALQVAEAFQYATGPMGRFHNGMEEMGKTDSGKIIAFKGALETLAGTIGVGLLPVVAGMIGGINWLGDNAGVMYGIAAAIGAMTIAWALYTGWIQRAAIWEGILAVIAFWPIALIGVIVGLVVWAAKSFEGWGKSINGLWGIIKSFVSSVGIGFKDFFQSIIYYGELFYLKIKSVFQYIGGTIANIANAMKLALTGDFAGAKKTLSLEVKTSASDEISKLQGERAKQSKDNASALDANRKSALASWGQVGLTRTKTAAKSLLDWPGQKFDPAAGGGGKGGTPAGVSDTANGISGGGARNLTINIAKQGIDQITIHAASVTEGAKEIERQFIEMFNRVINSGNAVVSN
jgi:tape measure domain-containing protein